MRFKGKSVIITGAGSGIGRAVADGFLKEGANVIICGRKKNIFNIEKKLKKHYGKNHIFVFRGDVSKEPDVRCIVKNTISLFGKIDILVNNAGVSGLGKIEDISLKQWDYVVRNNLTSCFLCSKYVIPHMKKRKTGKIINVSSIAGRFRSAVAGTHYTSSKGGVIAFTRQLAYEVAKYRINVNAVCPGQTDTPMLRKVLTKDLKKKLENTIPLGYIASPQQQANVILFLASDESNYMTGAVIDVNGGQF